MLLQCCRVPLHLMNHVHVVLCIVIIREMGCYFIPAYSQDILVKKYAVLCRMTQFCHLLVKLFSKIIFQITKLMCLVF